MKGILLICFLTLLFGVLTVAGNNFKEPITSTYTATLNAGQVVDGSDSGATGTGAFFFNAKTMTLSWTITHNVNNPLTADIHGPAAAGKNSKNKAVVQLPSATSPITGKAKLSTQQAVDLLNDLMYVIIHTANNPLGEIRGQIVLRSIEGIAKGNAKLSGSKMVPEVTTGATGSFKFSFSNLTQVMNYTIQHSVKNATAIHLHGPATETENAGVLLTFESPKQNSKGNFTLTEQMEEYLLNGLIYVAVHSDDNPAGEIRGQVDVTSVELGTADSSDSGMSGGEIFAIIFFVFVGIVALAGLGYFFYKKRAEAGPAKSVSPSGYRHSGSMGASLLDDAQQV